MSETNFSFREIVDISQLKDLFEAFSKATNLATTLLDKESNEILIKAGWRDICVNFHHLSPLTLKQCNLRKKEITDELKVSGQLETRHCLNGLIDGFTPIIINDKHLATIITGQVLFSPPDTDEFKERAKLNKFNEKAYLKALSLVPVVNEESFRSMHNFIAQIATMIAKAAITQIEMKLKSDEEILQKDLLKSLINSSPDLIFYKDLENKYLGCNKAMESLFKLKEEDILGKTDLELFPEKTALTHHQRNKKIVTSGITNRDIEWIRYSDGREAYHDTLCSPYIDPNGKIIGLIGVSRDITHLKETEEKLNVIINTVPDGILVIDPKTRKFLTANQTACNMFGYTLEEFHNIDIKDLHPEYQQTEFLKEFEMHIKQKKSASRDWPVQRKDGSIFQADITTGMGTLGGSQFLVGVVRDITDLKETAKELLKAKKLESVGMLAGGIAHDYNNILTAIIGNIGLAASCLAPQSEAYSFIKDAEAASIRAKSLTAQLLTFAKGGAPVKEATSIDKIIFESANIALQESNLCCNYNIQKDLWPVDLDSRQMNVVIKNIILNAKSAMPSGGEINVICENITAPMKVNQETTSSTELENINHVKIKISDSGTGISPKDIEHIFDPYFSTKNTSSGLGLAVCHSIVTKHGGKLLVESAINKGTTFTILLPASPYKSYEQNDKTVKDYEKLHIIIMDDEEMVRKVTRTMLEQLGHHVTLAKDGRDAVKLYDKRFKEGFKTDLIIMDLTVPDGMGGKEAIQEILKINPKAKAIVASGYSSDPVMANCKAYGFSASMNKPFEIADLKRIIEKTLS